MDVRKSSPSPRPKSVSIAGLIEGDRNLIHAHHWSLRVALKEFEAFRHSRACCVAATRRSEAAWSILGAVPGRDKQLAAISLDGVLEKRRLGQALNAKEFAVLVGVSYSTARAWFGIPGFPAFGRHLFWEDFVRWRAVHTGLIGSPDAAARAVSPSASSKSDAPADPGLMARASRLLGKVV